MIGRGGRHISRETAPGAVFGFCCGNDATERMWQHRTPQWVLGKSFDTHAPFGPWITTADEIADFADISMRLFVNGELRQEACTRDLIVDIPEMLAMSSAVMTLEPARSQAITRRVRGGGAGTPGGQPLSQAA